MEIGTRIKEMRKARNITQIQLAQMTGISQSSISAIEKLTNNPSAATLKLIAAALGCTVGELLGEKKEQEIPVDPLRASVIRDYDRLPPEAQRLVRQYIDLLRSR